MMTKLYQLRATTLWVSTLVIMLSVTCHGKNLEEHEDIKFRYLESKSIRYLREVNFLLTEYTKKVAKNDWNWSSNMTKHNAMIMYDMNESYKKFLKTVNNQTIRYPWKTYNDPDIRRQFKLLTVLGVFGTSDENSIKFDDITWQMKTFYSNATMSDYEVTGSSFEKDVNEIVTTSTDVKELKNVWMKWRDASGKKIRHMFPEYVRLLNENVRAINFTSGADFWMYKFEINDYRGQMERLWLKIKPLYQNLFAYVRRKLWLDYGYRVLSRRGAIPMHIVGDMWGQSWETLFKSTMPYRKAGVVDPTKNMNKKGYTPTKMYEIAEDFYKSLNFSPLPKSFWKNSIFENLKDRRVLCHPAAWDFQDSLDFRVKHCATVNFGDFLTAHRLLGQVYYAIQYREQPFIYRDGAFDGFQESVGDAVTLSVHTQSHLYKLGLSNNSSRDYKVDINHLYGIALDKIAFIPFAYIMDLWRWNVFDGITTEENYNCDWWDIRYKYQGYKPPVPRSEEDFEPGSKCHIIGNIPYIRFFLTAIMQFQFHQGLCVIAGEFDPNDPKSKPLHECNIYNSKKAGNVLKKMMKSGKSKPWYEIIEELTGTRDIDATPLMNYFKPLHEWLNKTNDDTGELLGWRETDTICMRPDGRKVPENEVTIH